MNYLKAAAEFLAAIGVLVAIHEFGHYWVAQRLGFKVLRFSIGFGRPLWLRRGREPDRTEYCISAIPLGGYVKLLDEREGEVATAELPRSFTRRPIAHRIAVLLAGPAMNLLFAVVLFAALAMVGVQAIKPFVGSVRPDSPAAIAGLHRGDLIVRVGDSRVTDTEELQIALLRQFSHDGEVRLGVQSDGAERALTLRVGSDREQLTEPGKLLPGLGFDMAIWRATCRIKEVPPSSAGARAGLRAEDLLREVDGHAVANSEEFIDLISAAGGHEVSIGIDRAGQHLSIVANVPTENVQGKLVGRLGIMFVEEGPRSWPPGVAFMRRSGPLDALLVGVQKTWTMSALTVQMLGRMAIGEVSVKNISGPLSIAEFAGVSASLGLTAFMTYLAVVSLSLGVLNLLPVPLLDGGQILYQLIEAAKGSPLSERSQMFGQKLGIALLVMLMSLAFYNDISRHLN